MFILCILLWDDPAQLESICHEVDAVIHIAGMNAGDCVRANVMELSADVKATENLLKAAIQSKVKRFIYLSSAHVYGTVDSNIITELSPILNEHHYAVNHRIKEKLILDALRNQYFDGVILRLSNAFGVPADHKC